MNRLIPVFLQFLCLIVLVGNINGQTISFPTDGHTVYHLRPATVSKDGSRSVISATYDGYLLCHTQQGQLLWKTQLSEGFPFDLAVGDMDGDGLEEAFVASSDGTLHAVGHDGTLKWKFETHPPLYQVSLLKTPEGTAAILTGGVERVLYALSKSGELISSCPVDGAIRLIGKRTINTDGEFYAAVATAKNGLSGNYTLRLHKLTGLSVKWEKPMSKQMPNNQRFFSIDICDTNNDGLDEMVFGMAHDKSDEIAIFDSKGNSEILKTCTAIKQRPYKMNFVSHIKSPTLNDEFYLNLSGSELLVFGMDGACRHILKGPYAFAATAFDPQTNIYWLGSGISGGDGIYGLRLDQPGWEKDFEQLKPVGKMVKLEANMKLLQKQVESFEPPLYQKPPSTPLVTVGESPAEIRDRYQQPYQMKNVQFASYYRFTEHYDPGITNPEMRAEWERFHSGKIQTQDEILKFAAEREASNENFFLFAGHGRKFGIDFYANPQTYFKMLRIAPKTLQGFVFAEFELHDQYMSDAIQKQLIPLADSCYKYGQKKIFLRNKNIFWNASVYLDVFKPLYSQEKYREIFVPCMEETNSRNQSLSLAGKTGLWLTQTFRHTAGRAVTDNANYNRLWEWGQTQHLSHFIRTLSLSRLLGADYFQVNIYTDNETEMLPFYLMLEKGILPKVEPVDLISISGLTVGITSPDEEFIGHGVNGHSMDLYAKDEPEFVFDRLDCYWGGALIPNHDFEKYAMNAKRRMTNFLPQSPFGNLTTISANNDLNKLPCFRRMLKTDGRYWYDENGRKHLASDYKQVVLDELEMAAKKLPLRVTGDVAWVAVRISPKYIRLVLIDPGYLDPDDRHAEVLFQNLNVKAARDILSGVSIPTDGNKMNIDVPMGILRIIDLELKK